MSSTLVLLGPVGLDVSAWNLVPLPAVIRHEYPGHGARPPATSHTPCQRADDLVASHPGILDLVGISMGAIVAMHAALRHPGRVRSLLLVCAGADTDPQATLERISLIESAGMGPMVAPMLERWFTMDALTQEPEHPGVAYTRQILRGLSPRTFADDWRVVARHDVRERLHEIHVPTTCVAGNQDKSATPARVGTLAAGIPGARMMVVQGPHLLHLERPQVFSGALGTHLRFVEQSQ